MDICYKYKVLLFLNKQSTTKPYPVDSYNLIYQGNLYIGCQPTVEMAVDTVKNIFCNKQPNPNLVDDCSEI